MRLAMLSMPEDSGSCGIDSTDTSPSMVDDGRFQNEVLELGSCVESPVSCWVSESLYYL
jgi:hypothetical protein